MEKKPYVIGLDLGGTNSVFGIVDGKANVVASVSVKTKGHGTAEQYVIHPSVFQIKRKEAHRDIPVLCRYYIQHSTGRDLTDC